MSGKAVSAPITWLKKRSLVVSTQLRSITQPAEYCTPGILAIACASSGVSVLALPMPVGIFDSSPPRVKLPECTKIKVVPARLTSEETDPVAPVPKANMVSTAATPMVMPRTAKPVRSLFCRRALYAIRKLVVSIIHT